MNKQKFLASLIIISLSLFSVSFQNTTTAKSPYKRFVKKQAFSLASQNYKPGEILIKYKSSTSQAKRNLLNKGAGVQKTLQQFRLRNKQTIDLVKVKSSVGVEEAVSELEQREEVEYAEPNYIYHTSWTPDDTSFANQWGFNNSGQTIQSTAGTADADIDAVEAWGVEQGETSPVMVAVIDSGIDTTHTELSSKLWTNTDEVAGNGLDDDSNGYVDDVNGYNWAGISNYTYNVLWSFGNSNTYPRTQSIKGTGTSLTSIGLLLAKYGSPGNLTVSVRNSLDGAILSSFAVANTEVSSAPSYGEVYKTLSSPVGLTAGQTYYIQIQPASTDASNYYYIGSNDNGESDYVNDPYVDGQEHRYNGASWDSVTYADNDLYFRTNPNGFPKDNNGHGTHVSGIVAATTNNATGVAGTSPGAKIMALKAGDSSGSLYTSDIINAIDYARLNGADIINMSFGSTSYSASEQDALTNAYNAGVTLLAASGNSYDTTMQYPAGMSNVIGVGATTNQDVKAPFSTYNGSVDISAPGKSIYSTMPSYEVGLNSYDYTQNYSYMSGTSMASPMAAGVGALVVSKNPSYTPSQVQQALQNYADDLGSAGRDDSFGYGRVNAYNSLTNSVPDEPSPSPDNPPADTTPPSSPAVVSPTHPSSSKYYSNTSPSFSLSASDASAIAGYSYSIDATPSTPDTIVDTTGSSITLTNVANGSWYLNIRAVDSAGNWSSASNITFNIDTSKPKTSAKRARAKRKGKKRLANVNLRWYVNDIYTGGQAKVILRIKKKYKSPTNIRKKANYLKLYKRYRKKYSMTKNKKLKNHYLKAYKKYYKAYKRISIYLYKTLKTVNYGWTAINKWRSYQYKTRTTGTLYYFIYAADKAGNKQGNIASNSLIVT